MTRFWHWLVCMFSSAEADDFVYRFPPPREK